MPNFMEVGTAWFTEQVLDHAGRSVTYHQSTGDTTITAAASQETKTERTTRRGRVLMRSRRIRFGRSDIANPVLNQDAVTINGVRYTVTDIQPQGTDYAFATLESESLIESGRETYRDF